MCYKSTKGKKNIKIKFSVQNRVLVSKKVKNQKHFRFIVRASYTDIFHTMPYKMNKDNIFNDF